MGAKVRLIPVLLLKNGTLVRSEGFREHQIIGNPINEVRRFNEWNVDELIYLDITRSGAYDLGRDDHRHKHLSDPLDILSEVSKTCFMPLTWGGRLRTLDDMRECFARGADKITINSAALADPSLITRAARAFGSQAIVVSMDVRRVPGGGCEVFAGCGSEPTGLDPVTWARRAAQAGCGELLLQHIDEDGSARGYDLEYIRQVSAAVDVPVIACSGVGQFDHYAHGITAGASAVAAANIWHFKELADRQGKRALSRAGVEIRPLPAKRARRAGG